ncbi:hypothetical protein HanOQP8_Chr17g0667591 [Helianthus annuus]|nr:hypothetical protein HanOQP8_Chr17g0667591 [Helianthus annuus]
MGAFYMDNKPILKELKLIEKFAFLWKIALVNFLHKMSKGKSCFFLSIAKRLLIYALAGF